MESVGQFDIDIDDQNDHDWHQQEQSEQERRWLEQDVGYAQFLFSIAQQGV